MVSIIFKFSFINVIAYENLSIAIHKGKFDGNLVIFSDLIAQNDQKEDFRL